MSFIHKKCRECLIRSEALENEISTLNEKELVTYIEKNTGENKELFLFLLKDLGLNSFKKYISKTAMSNKFSLSDNNELLDFVKKLSNMGVKKVSIVKFVLQYSHYNKTYYNTFEFYKLLDSVLHFNEEERKQLQNETILLTFKNGDKENAKAFIKMVENEIKENEPEDKQFYRLYDYFSYYNDVIYDNLEFIDYESLKNQFFKARYKGLDFNIQLKNNLPQLPKYQIDKQVSTTFLGLAIKKLDFDFAKALLFEINSTPICSYNEKEKRIALVESCEVFANSQEEKAIINKLKELLQ